MLVEALLKTDETKVVDYIAFNDFTISDIKRDSTDWIVLLSDFNQNNAYWKSKQQIQVIKLDMNLNQIWKYVSDSDQYPLNGLDIKVGENKYLFKAEIITGCHICLVVAQVELSKDGTFKSVQHIQNQNGKIEFEKLPKIFGNP